MAFLRRRAAGPTVDVVPWEGSGLRAEFALLRAGRRREAPSVVLTAGEARVQLHAGEVRDLVRGRAGIAESAAPPLAFLCRPGSAAGGSVVHEVVGHLPSDSLALVTVDEGPVLAAVLDGVALSSFTAWADPLPG